MAPPPPSSDAAAVEALGRTVMRLVAEWGELRRALGLGRAASWSELAEALGLDRGTAQRLVRCGRLGEVDAHALDHLPGGRGWGKVLQGARRSLGADHPAAERLRGAIEELASSLAPWSGSKAAAVRSLRASLEEPPTGTFDDRRARASWFRAASEVVGYSVGLRINLQILRTSPTAPERLDLAMVNAFVDCQGRVGAMPMAITRFATLDGSTPLRGPEAANDERYRVLHSIRSTPPPSVLLTGDSKQQMAFLEPQWPGPGTRVDVAVLQHEPRALPSPWCPGPQAGAVLDLSTLAKHPSRRQITAALLAPELAGRCDARFAAYRDLSSFAGQRNWFDRLPEHPPLARTLAADPAPANEVNALLEEVEQHLAWDLPHFTRYLADVRYPIPLARYTIELEVSERLGESGA